jgi:hypothetical protein
MCSAGCCAIGSRSGSYCPAHASEELQQDIHQQKQHHDKRFDRDDRLLNKRGEPEGEIGKVIVPETSRQSTVVRSTAL